MNSGASEATPEHGRWAVLCAIAAVAWTAPLVAFRYFPGLDMPWHAAVVAVLSAGSQEAATNDFLGYYTVEWRLSSNASGYAAAAALARVLGDAAVAIQVLMAAYVLAFAHASYRLLRALGGTGAMAALALPAAWSVTLEFGFMGYALSYPLTLWLWAVIASSARAWADGRGRAWRVCATAVLTALVAVTNPYAAAIAIGGAAVLVLTLAPGVRAGLACAGAIALGAIPAAIAVTALGGGDAGGPDPTGGLWHRLTAHQYSSPGEALAGAAPRLFGFVSDGWTFAIAAAGLAAAVVARHAAGPPEPPRSPNPAAGRAPIWMVVALALAYLLTPYTFEWPRLWHAAQPRVLPLLWVAALAALRAGPRVPGRGRVAAMAPAAASAAALAVLLADALIPHARESADFGAVVAASAPRARTLALVEQRRTVDREPASPWRHAGGWIVARRGGFTAHLPMTAPSAGNAGVIVPVRRSDSSPPTPRAPLPGYARTFVWDRHAAGWDQFLIRDADPRAPFDFFGAHAGKVELVARHGRWRLYRRSALPAGRETGP